MPDAAPAARGVYKPRQPQASPLFRLVSDHPHRLQTVYDERFAREYGPWRPVVGDVADKFLACGVLEHGFARIRCDDCAHEYLLAFSCKCRYFCPSCHAKRLAIWTQWLNTTLLAPVPHRQVVPTIPKRLRAYCLYRHRLLGEIARVAARTVTAAIRTLTGERDLAVGLVACLQTHGSRANCIRTCTCSSPTAAFGPTGRSCRGPHTTWRAVLRLFVRLELFDADQAAGMLTWPHSGFHVHTAVWVPEDDRAFASRLARYGARNPVALERLTYDQTAKAVTYRSDKSAGPIAGTETAVPLEFLARVLVHIPEKGHVTTRCYGWYANRPRGMRPQAEPAPTALPAIVSAPRLAPRLAPTEASRRWATLLQQIFKVDPLACPTCHGPKRVVAFITQASVIDRILAQLRTRSAREAHAGPRSPPSTRAARRAPHARSPTLRRSPEDGPDAPPPRGDRRRGRPSHRRGSLVSAGIAPPTVNAVPTALEARELARRHANARQTVLPRSAIASYTRRIVDPSRLKFLSRVHGNIVTPGSLAPIQAVAITLTPLAAARQSTTSSVQTYSDDAGAFRIDSVTPARYLLQVRRLGYQPVRDTVHVHVDSGVAATAVLAPEIIRFNECGAMYQEVRVPWWKR